MTSYTLSPVWGAGAQLFDNNGDPLSGGKVYVYDAGSTTPAITYIDPIGSFPNANPIILDAAGRLSNEIWFLVGRSYKFVLKTSNDVLIATYDNIPSLPQPAVTNDAASINYSTEYLVTAGSFTPGKTYQILTIGTTDFTSIGASANVTGLLFTATAPGTGTGTAYYSRNIQSKLRETVSVTDFGAIGDGSADDTTAIQAALNSAGVISFPAGTYVTNPINVASNTTLVFSPETVLLAKTGYGINDRLLNISNVSNVTVEGNYGKIRMLKSEYSTGEQRHGVFIVTGTNVCINNLIVEDTGGDGFYIGSYDNVSPSYNVTLNSCVSDNARRNGLSIVSVKNCWINGGEFKNTKGTAPQAGVDIEPNGSFDYLWNVNLNGVVTRNNVADGFLLALNLYSNTSNVQTEINLNGCTSDGDANVFGTGGFRVANGPVNSYRVEGTVNFTNCSSFNSGFSGVTFLNLTDKLPYFQFTNTTIVNPGNLVSASSAEETAAIFLLTSYNSIAAPNTTANIAFDRLLIADYRSTPKMQIGAYVAATANYPIRNVSFSNVTIRNQVSTPYVIRGIGAGTVTDIAVVNDNTETFVLNGTTPEVSRFAGYKITSTASGNFGLPLANSVKGLTLTFAATASTMSLVPDPTDRIYFQNLAVGAALVLIPNDSLQLQAVTGGWAVVSSDFPLITGSGSPVGVVVPWFVGRSYFDTLNSNFWVSTGLTAANWKQTT